MLVRKATLKDLQSIVLMWQEFMKDHDHIVFRENPRLKPYQKRKNNAATLFKKYLKKNIRSRNSLVLIAEVEGKPAGYSLNKIKTNVPIFALGRIGHLSDLFVRKKYRRNGISSKFKNEVFKWFKKKWVKHISIMVNATNNKAHKIYKKWGFLDYHMEMRRKL